MKTLTIVKEIDSKMNDLTQHSLTLERDNILLRQAVRTMFRSIALTESGETTLQLTEKDVEYLKRVCDQCDVFATGASYDG